MPKTNGSKISTFFFTTRAPPMNTIVKTHARFTHQTIHAAGYSEKMATLVVIIFRRTITGQPRRAGDSKFETDPSRRCADGNIVVSFLLFPPLRTLTPLFSGSQGLNLTKNGRRFPTGTISYLSKETQKTSG